MGFKGRHNAAKLAQGLRAVLGAAQRGTELPTRPPPASLAQTGRPRPDALGRDAATFAGEALRVHLSRVGRAARRSERTRGLATASWSTCTAAGVGRAHHSTNLVRDFGWGESRRAPSSTKE